MYDPPPNLPFKTVLIANRGEIAIRFIHALHQLNLTAATIYVSDESTSPHVKLSDISYNLGTCHTNYNDIARVIQAANHMNVDAVLPGYGFLSENADAAAQFEKCGITWIGPTSDMIHLFGMKHTAREAAVNTNIPVVPGSKPIQSLDQVYAEIQHIGGLPILFKSSAGGGGMGQVIVKYEKDIKKSYESIIKQSKNLFNSSIIFMEKYIEFSRHIEVQVFGDGKGHVIAISDRDCTIQRRRQKIIEEAPSANISHNLRLNLHRAAVQLCSQYSYNNVGTVEFIVDVNNMEHNWYFLEVNTRLQVEHGITELITGVDLVHSMIFLAAGIDYLNKYVPELFHQHHDKHAIFPYHGHAMQLRLCAENPIKDYKPSPGIITELMYPTEAEIREELGGDTRIKVRIDKWAEKGITILSHYDSLLFKLMVWTPTRDLSILALIKVLNKLVIHGIDTNKQLHYQILNHKDFIDMKYTTKFLSPTLNHIKPSINAIEVLNAGLQSSLQDYPGRIGYWSIGVSPSGPMDAYAMNIANSLVGNFQSSSTTLEMIVKGCTLLFHCDTVIALTGCKMKAKIQNTNRPVRYWTPINIKKGEVLEIDTVVEGEGGKISYLAVEGGFHISKYLGSTSTFATGKFGGLKGTYLQSGDFLPLKQDQDIHTTQTGNEHLNKLVRWPLNKPLMKQFIPDYKQDSNVWVIGALNGPHASEDFLQQHTLMSLWTTQYVIHHATNRLGTRLIGPVPKWTRTDGGSAGLHPSNLHDYTYAPGAVNLSGNTAIILMLDGPSLGGFVCPITIASCELWKVAQASPSEKIQFKQVDFDTANQSMKQIEAVWDSIRRNDVTTLESISKQWTPWWITESKPVETSAILYELKRDNEMKVCYRQSGDEHVLVEYGEIQLDLKYRFRVHLLMEQIKEKDMILELCPGVRSLLIKFNRHKIHLNDLIQQLITIENTKIQKESIENLTLQSRKLMLPLAFDDQWTKEAQLRYLRSVRPNAPYMPSNIDFIKRINGLQSIDEMKNMITATEYMVLGLGDVYLGAPCAVPVDPRHRLITSKYNPARTYTPEGAVGIGGAYMCIYGMDSPGGYQLIGRTLPIWDNYGNISEECRGSPKHIPWLLRFFDRVQFFLVSDDELERQRSKFRKGDLVIDIQNDTFSSREYHQFLEDNKQSIEDFESKRNLAYNEERKRWDEQGEGSSDAASKHASTSNRTEDDEKEQQHEMDLPENAIKIYAGVSANVWSVCMNEGDKISKGNDLFILESMKVEISIDSPIAGTMYKIFVNKGESVQPDTLLGIIEVTNDEGKEDDEEILTINGIRKMMKLGLMTEGRLLTEYMRRVEKTTDIMMYDKEEIKLELEKTIDLKNDYNRYESLSLLSTPFVILKDVEKNDALIESIKNEGGILMGSVQNEQYNLMEVMKSCVFCILNDTHGNSIYAAENKVANNVIMLRLSEGLLPISDGDDAEDWDEKNSFSICTRGGGHVIDEDIQLIFNACLSSRNYNNNSTLARSLSSIQKDILEGSSSSSSSGGGGCHADLKRMMIGCYEYDESQDIYERLVENGFELKKDIFTGWLDKKVSMKLRRAVDNEIWSQDIDVIVFIGRSSSVGKAVGSFGWCCLSMSINDGRDEITFVSNSLNDNYLLQIAKTNIFDN